MLKVEYAKDDTWIQWVPNVGIPLRTFSRETELLREYVDYQNTAIPAHKTMQAWTSDNECSCFLKLNVYKHCPARNVVVCNRGNLPV